MHSFAKYVAAVLLTALVSIASHSNAESGNTETTPMEVLPQGIALISKRPALFFQASLNNLSQRETDDFNRNFLRFVEMKHHAEISDDRIFDILSLLDTDDLKKMAAEAAADALPELTDNLLAAASGQGARDMRVRLLHQQVLKNDFERKRFIELGRARVGRIAAANPLPEPIQVIIVCGFRLLSYDFERGSFPVDTQFTTPHCGTAQANARRPYRMGVDVDIRGFPLRIEMSAQDAEHLQQQLYRGAGLISFNASMTSFVSDVPGRGKMAAYAARRIGPIAIHSRDNFDNPLHVISDASIQRQNAEAARIVAEAEAAREKKQAEAKARQQAILQDQARQRQDAARKKAEAAQAERDKKAAEQSEKATAAARSTIQAEERFAVRGVKIGDDVEAVSKQIREKLGQGPTYYATREARRSEHKRGFAALNSPIKDWSPFHEATLFASADGHDLIAIYHEPPARAGEVTGISRSRLFETGSGPKFTSLIAQIEDTYGKLEKNQKVFRHGENFMHLWSGAMPGRKSVAINPNQRGCMMQMQGSVRAVGSGLRSAATQRQAGLPPLPDAGWGWIDDGGVAVEPGALRPPKLATAFTGAKGCPDFMLLAFWVFSDSSGIVLEYHQALARPVSIARIAKENETVVMNAPTVEPELDL